MAMPIKAKLERTKLGVTHIFKWYQYMEKAKMRAIMMTLFDSEGVEIITRCLKLINKYE